MSNERAVGEASAHSAPLRWLTVHDELLAGIAHAFANRIACVIAVAHTLENGDAPGEQIQQSLRDETGRMEGLLNLLRALPGKTGANAEPATANDLCSAAVTMHAYHPEFRNNACDIVVDAAVYPVWVEPVSFQHALLLALTAAKRHAANGERVSLHVAGDIGVVTFSVVAESAATHDASELDASDAGAAAWLIAPFGGSARVMNGGCELQVATLMAARKAQRERTAR